MDILSLKFKGIETQKRVRDVGVALIRAKWQKRLNRSPKDSKIEGGHCLWICRKDNSTPRILSICMFILHRQHTEVIGKSG